MAFNTTPTTKLGTGSIISQHNWQDAFGKQVLLPDPTRWTHLQFRRFSGCAVCNLHLKEFIDRQKELQDAGIHEVIVFNSTRARILDDLPRSPFPIIADHQKRLYRDFGVEDSPLAVFNPRVWLPALRGAIKFGVQLPRDQETMNGLPADFLIDCHGKIVAAHYGKHAYDQWSFNKLLELVGSRQIQEQHENATV